MGRSDLRDLRWHEYMRVQPDLQFDNEEDARWHLVYNGYCKLSRANVGLYKI